MNIDIWNLHPRGTHKYTQSFMDGTNGLSPHLGVQCHRRNCIPAFAIDPEFVLMKFKQTILSERRWGGWKLHENIIMHLFLPPFCSYHNISLAGYIGKVIGARWNSRIMHRRYFCFENFILSYYILWNTSVHIKTLSPSAEQSSSE